MPIHIEMPDNVVLEFPDSMSASEIREAVQTHYLPQENDLKKAIASNDVAAVKATPQYKALTAQAEKDTAGDPEIPLKTPPSMGDRAIQFGLDTGMGYLRGDPAVGVRNAIMGMLPESVSKPIEKAQQFAAAPLIGLQGRMGLSAQGLADATDVLSEFGPENPPQDAADLEERLGSLQSRKPTLPEKILAGAQQAVMGGVESLETPTNLAALGGGAFLKGAAGKALTTYFTAEMIKALPDDAKLFVEGWKEGDAEKVTKAMVGAGVNAVFVKQALSHLVTGKPAAAKEAAPAKEIEPPAQPTRVPAAPEIPQTVQDAQEIITAAETRKGLPEKIATDVDAMSGEEFTNWKKQIDQIARDVGGEKPKQPAYTLGEQAPNEEFVQRLKTLADKWKKAGDDAIAEAAAEKDGAKQADMLSAAQAPSQKAQFFREAWERARGIGSAIEGEIGYEAPFPETKNDNSTIQKETVENQPGVAEVKQAGGLLPTGQGREVEVRPPEKAKAPETQAPSVTDPVTKDPPPKPAEPPKPEPPQPPQSSGGLGITPFPHGAAAVNSLMEWIKDAPRKAKVLLAQLAGKAAPHTSTASEASGNSLVHYASARIAAPVVARSMATDVLGPHHKDEAFGARLGAVLVEDRLRAIRQGFIDAGDVTQARAVGSVLGKAWSPFRNNREFRAALADPEIQAAIARHKSTVQPTAQAAHEQARGELAGVGLHTGAFVNLKALMEGIDERNPAAAARGNLENPLRRLSRFFHQASGTAAKYEIDYRTLAERMITGNFEEAAKRGLYDQLVSDGLAVIKNPGDPRPAIGKAPPVKFTIERRGAPAGTGADGSAQARTYIQNLWVRADIAGELRQALNTDGAVGRAGFTTAANVINRLQLAGPTDAVWHTANMLGSIAGSQGGRTLLSDLARKLPGVNIADTVGRVVASGIRVLRDSPEVQRQLADLAEMGALREPHKSGFMGRGVQFIDKAGRLVRNDLFSNLVQRGLAADTEANRREFVNQMGQYNGRLMGQFQRFFKEAGFSPFIVAGRNFNRMAMRRLALSPGVKASSPAAAAQMRAVEAFGTIATLFAVPALINYAISGNTRNDLKTGQIGTGKKNSEGKEIVIDPAQWSGLRRGLRISGAQAVTEGLRHGDLQTEITRSAAHDVLGGIMHPWTGPGVTAASVAATGYDPRFYKDSVNPKDVGANVTAALKQLNPVAAAIIRSHEKGQPHALGELASQLGGAAGVKANQPETALRQMLNKAAHFQVEHGYGPKGWTLEQNDDPSYTKIRSALRSGDDKGALKLMQALRATIPDKEIARSMQDHIRRPLTGSKAHEKEFLDSLNAKEAALYDAARDEQKEELERFKLLWERRDAKAPAS